MMTSRATWSIALLGLFLFGIANLPWQLDDYDQAKQAFTSFQMVNSGDWLYQTTPHDRIATKPPLVGWVSSGLFAISRSWELAWRLPSLLSAVGIGVLLFRFTSGLGGNAVASIALAAFAFNLMTPRLATLVRTDMPLALVIFLIGATVWDKLRKEEAWRPNDRVLIFLLLTAGMLIKGPVIWAFLLPGLIAFQLWPAKSDRSQAFPGTWPWIASLAVFALWVAAGIKFKPGFYDEVVVHEFLGRFGGEAHRAQPLLFYLPHLVHKFAPWSVLMIGLALVGLRQTKWAWRNIGFSPGTRWLICWIAGGFIVMSLLPSKRVDRIFPIVPALCLLLGVQIKAVALAPRWHSRVYQWGAATAIAALVMSGGYFGWKVWTGYHENRGALVEFGSKVRQVAGAKNWRYAVVASPDEGLLLYLRKLNFVLPQRAIDQWNADQLDALVVSTRDQPDITPQLTPAGTATLQSTTHQKGDTLDYVLITKP